MWAEARKQERKIRGMLVDYRKRAERRQCFYDKIKGDPTQFLQLHGRKVKIHLDQGIAIAAQKIMMPWDGQKDCLIDRFDVRAHLDFIPPPVKLETEPEISSEERQLNYERYRILAQNDFLGIHEEKFLYQLNLEEQFGVNAQVEMEKSSKKKGAQGPGAAIGYTYEENDSTITPFSQTISSIEATRFDDDYNKEEDSDSDVDMDVSIDITKIQTNQAHELNSCGRKYGMLSNDFYSFLTKDYDEIESLKLAREEEAEKIMLVGRKSRRERRALREKKYLGRPLSPPSYAAKVEKPVKEGYDEDSRSPSPENSGKITYITSFGGEDELQPHSKISITLNKSGKVAGPSSNSHQLSYAEKVKENLDKLKKINDFERTRESSFKSRRRSRDRRSRSVSRSRMSNRKRRYSSTSSSSRSRSPVPRKRKVTSSSSSSSSSTSPERMEVDLEKKNASPIKKLPENSVTTEPPPVKRYYGRKRDEDRASSSEISLEENEDGENKAGSNESSTNEATSTKKGDRFGKSTASNSTKGGTQQPSSSSGPSNLREKLKRKMQILLNKQYKADKKAEIERLEKQIQQQQDRDEEMRELALKLRKRQRELRHKYGSPGSPKSGDSKSDNKSESEDSDLESRKRHHQGKSNRRSRSKSRSYSRNRRRRSSSSVSSYENRNRRSRSYTRRQRHYRRPRSRSRSRSYRSRDRNYSRNYSRRKSYSPDSRYSNSRRLVDY